MGSADLVGLQGEVRELEDKLAEARAKERMAQGNALRNTIMMVDTLEPKWMEMEAERLKLKALKVGALFLGNIHHSIREVPVLILLNSAAADDAVLI
jgi:hypothetical protein